MDTILDYVGKNASRHYKKQIVLLCPGDKPNNIYLLQKGCVKVYRFDQTGEEQIIDFKTTGDIFPERLVFGRKYNSLYYYETVEDSDIVTVNLDDFLQIVDSRSELKNYLFDYMSRKYTSMIVHIAALKKSHAADKILMMMYYLMVRHGVERKPGVFWINIKMRHATLASLTGLTRETVTTELGKLRKKRVVQYTMQRFIVYKTALQERIDDELTADTQSD